MRRRERVAALIDIAQMDRRSDLDASTIRRFRAGDQLEQGGLARAVGADHPDDPTRRQVERQIVEQ